MEMNSEKCEWTNPPTRKGWSKTWMVLATKQRSISKWGESRFGASPFSACCLDRRKGAKRRGKMDGFLLF